MDKGSLPLCMFKWIFQKFSFDNLSFDIQNDSSLGQGISSSRLLGIKYSPAVKARLDKVRGLLFIMEH